MVHIKVTNGLDLPIDGEPTEEIDSLESPTHVALDLTPFDLTKFRLLVQVGDQVKIGDPLVEDKKFAGRNWCSPGGGEGYVFTMSEL